MSELPLLPTKGVLPLEHGRHFDLVKDAIPPYLINAKPELRAELRRVKPRVPGWYTATTQTQKDQLKSLFENRFNSQKKLDEILGRIQPVKAFAQPLLEAALKNKGYVLPVNEVHVRLYAPVEDAFGVYTGGYSVQTLSLLQAALHNFEAPQAEAGFFASESGFITAPDAQGRFRPYPTSLDIETFAQLCRELDIGEKYQTYLQPYLGGKSVVSETELRTHYMGHQKDVLKLDARLALMSGDIGWRDYELVMRVINGEQRIMRGEKQVWYRIPCLMGMQLKGCLVIDPCIKYRYSDEIIVWIPGDPEHPLKRYASFADFRNELIRQLTPGAITARQTDLTPYQQFLSRFIEQKSKPYYYKRLTALIKDAPEESVVSSFVKSDIGRLLTEVFDPQLAVRLESSSTWGSPAHTSRVLAEHPDINVNVDAIKGIWVEVDPWDEMLEVMRARLFADARNLAISTGDADANNRSSRLSHSLNIGLFAVNLVAMVVPPLGEAMMVVMAGQLLYEVLEGAIEWEEGDLEAAWDHIGDVLENLAMLVAGAAVAHVAVKPVIEKLQRVTLPGGKAQLWRADLTPYERSIEIAPHATPNEAGVYTLNGQDVLLHEGKQYVVKKDPVSEHYRAVHPTRPDAYQPEFRHNGHGVWVHEGEQPLTWERATLKSRLGPLAEGFSDSKLEQILQVCDVQEEELRRMYVENEPTPLLLVETLRQFKAYSRAMEAVGEVRAGRLSNDLCSYSATFTVELPGWPASKAFDLYDSLSPQTPATRYGSTQATGADVIRISREELMKGKLPERVVDSLNQQQLEDLLGEYVPFERHERLELFKERLISRMEAHPQRLFASLYEAPLMETEPARASIERVKRLFPKLPTAVARRLVAEASLSEQAVLKEGKVPARLMSAARTLQRDIRLSSAYLGLYLDALVTADTETLVLNTLPELPGWKDNLRLEVRSDTFSGKLRASLGPSDAANRKVLVRTSDGKYRALDEVGNQLHGVDGLYSSLQHALPDTHRAALGLPHVGQGGSLKLKVQQHALPHAQLRVLLNIRSESRPFFLPPQRLPDGRLGYPLSGRGASGALSALEETFKLRLRQLYPDMTDASLAGFFEAYGRGTSAGARISALEAEFLTLGKTLDQWLRTPVDGVPVGEYPTDAQRPTVKSRVKVRRRLLDAWRSTGPQHLDGAGRLLGQGLLIEPELGHLLDTLPPLPADFGHVTQLVISDAGLTDGVDGFLAHFSKLRSLELNNNQLTRLPASIGQMSRLELLDLSSNYVVLTPESVEQLKGLTGMRLMSLEHSPLGLSPDISRMPHLGGLFLSGCGLDRWPVGLLDQPRARTFRLYLESSALTHIPDVELGSKQAETLARTVVTHDMLSEDVVQTYKRYSESVGIDPDRLRPPGGEIDSRNWVSGFTAEEKTVKQAIWDRVEHAKGAEPFFNVIRDQANNFQYRTHAFKTDMISKVWRMLQAMDESPALRDKLFQMAKAPFTCVDAGAQLFNSMGVEVLLHEAYQAPQEWLVRLEVFDVARGKARLDQLGRIARARVAELEAQGRHHPEYVMGGGQRVNHYDAEGNQLLDIDEVEIYLAYTTQLANRLDLPWQSPSMMFNEPDVIPVMLDNAYEHIRELERGEGLRNQLLELPMWTDFIEGAHRSEFNAVKNKMEALNDFQDAQQAWVAGEDLTGAQQADLRIKIEKAGQLLDQPASAMTPGRVMTDQEYDAQLLRLSNEHRQVLQTLTEQALAPTVEADQDEPMTGRGDV